MFRMKGEQIRRLREAIQDVYGGPHAGGLFWQFLFERLDVQLSDLTSAGTFPLQVSEVLHKLNADGKALELLNQLEQAHPQAGPLLQVISQLRAEAKTGALWQHQPKDVYILEGLAHLGHFLQGLNASGAEGASILRKTRF